MERAVKKDEVGWMVEQMRQVLSRTKFVRPETIHPYTFIGTEEGIDRLARCMEECDSMCEKTETKDQKQALQRQAQEEADCELWD